MSIGSIPKVLIAELVQELNRNYLNNIKNRKSFQAGLRIEPSFGIEHEFFLISKNGKLIKNLDESIEVFNLLVDKFKWKKYFIDGSKDISSFRVYFGDSNNYNAVKFEYAPHLVEISTSPSTNLSILENNLNKSINDFLNAAELLGISILFKSHVIDSSFSPIGEFQIQREAFRKNILKESNEKRIIKSFPGGIAATQVHVGGFAWWEGQFMNNLYKLEADFSLIPFIFSDNISIEKAVENRWSKYFRTYGTFDLFAFPNIDNWTLENYFKTGLNNLRDDNVDFGSIDLAKYFSEVVDLQLIKPSKFGTIEFRSAPACSSFSTILALLEYRQMMIFSALHERCESISIPRNKWNEAIRTPTKLILSKQIHQLRIMVNSSALPLPHLKEELKRYG